MTGEYDIAVIGSGFAGSLMAMIARRLGLSVALIDKGKHPRFAIGESSTPLANLLLEEIAVRYDLPRLAPLAKWGSWQSTYPGVACGLKRGFSFYHHDWNHPRGGPPDRAAQLLVAASPHDRVADTHWYRADFDQLLAEQAEEIGVDSFDETVLQSATHSGSALALDGDRGGKTFRARARFVVDASGPRGFLHRALRLGERPLPDYPATQALYAHFSGVGRLDEAPFGSNLQPPPYPIDDAAVHHVFDGGWVWVLKFNNGIASAGVVATEAAATRLRLAEGEPAWRKLLPSIPALAEQFAHAKHVVPFTYRPRVSFRSQTAAGDRWALLPSAAGFVDPLLSTGFPLALLGVARLGAILENGLDAEDLPDRLRTYAAQTEDELLATARLIAALYANMRDFPVFSALAMLYFAAASYSETARRLGKPWLAQSFLLHDHPAFGAATRELLGRARLARAAEDSRTLIADILAAVEPFNVAALGDPRRKNWYPADAEDLLASAGKLGANREEIAGLLERCGFHRAAV